MASAVMRPAPLPRWFWLASLLGCTPGFKKSRCKRLLKKTMSRIKLLKGRREVQVRQLRRDVAQLLQLGQEENAQNRLDRLWKEHSLLSAYIKIGEYCLFVKANLRNIAGLRECPMDLKESLASLCFSASCCADLPELQELRDILVMKYGNTFLTSAHELLPGEHVNRLFLDAFSTKHPLEISKKALLKSIIAEYNVVQPKKSKVHGIGGASQQSRHDCGSIAESCKQDPKPNALEQDEVHRKQSRHSISTPASGAFTEEHAFLPHVEEGYDRKMVGHHTKEQKDSHFQGDTVQCGVNEVSHASQQLTPIIDDRHGKEKFKSRLKGFKNKKNARVSQAGQADQLTPSNRMSFYENSGPYKKGNDVMHGLQQVHRNSENERVNEVKEVQVSVIGQHLLQENVDTNGHARHRENKHFNQDYRAETNEQVIIARSLKHGYHVETLSDDGIAHQMLQQGYKKHDLVEREAHTRSNGKVRPDRYAFNNEEQERELYHMGPKSKPRGSSNKKSTNDFDNEQLEKSPQRRKHHAERGTKADAHRIDSSPNGIDYKRSPLTGNGVMLEQREPPSADCNFGDTKHIHKSISNSALGRATDEQVRSPCQRNRHVEGEIGFEKPKPGRETCETRNWKASSKGNGYLPEYGDGAHKVQKEKVHSSNINLEDASCRASSIDHPNAHMLQKGRKQQGRKQPEKENQADHEAVVPERASNLSPGSHICADMEYESKYHARQRERNFHLMENLSTVASFRQGAWADYYEAVVPERGMNLSPSSYIHADDTRYNSKNSAMQREKNFYLMEGRPSLAHSDMAWDIEAARQRETAPEPCIDGDLPGNGGNVRQKHTRLAKRHISDHAKYMRPKQEGIAEGTENVQIHKPHSTNGSHVSEDDSNVVVQCEREHFPQWHDQFDPIPDTRAFPQGASARGERKEQKFPKNLSEDLQDSSCSRRKAEASLSPSRFANPPQRPPPPVPPYRVSSMPNRKPLNSPPALRQRCATLETSHVRTNHEPHVHPKLPEYEDLVASFAALKNKPARPPMG